MKSFVLYSPATLADKVGLDVPHETFLPVDKPYSTFIHDTYMKGYNLALAHGRVNDEDVMFIIVEENK